MEFQGCSRGLKRRSKGFPGISGTFQELQVVSGVVQGCFME